MQVLLEEIEKTLRRIIREEIRSALELREAPPAPVEQPAEAEKLMNSKEAAVYCRTSEVSLWRMRKNSEIGFFRVGNRVLYSMEKHLIPFLESRERKPRK